MTTGPTLRHDQREAVRERILVATVEVIEAGDEPTMRNVARAASIAERTLYRYFASREELYEAVVPRVRLRAGAPMAESLEELPRYIRTLYTTFAHNAPLVRALITASWFPGATTRSENLHALNALFEAGLPAAPAAERAAAVASLRVLYSAAGWAYLDDCGFTLEQSIAHVQWATAVVLEKLRGGRDA